MIVIVVGLLQVLILVSEKINSRPKLLQLHFSIFHHLSQSNSRLLSQNMNIMTLGFNNAMHESFFSHHVIIAH